MNTVMPYLFWQYVGKTLEAFILQGGFSRKNTFSENPYIMDKKEICGPLESVRRYGKKGGTEWEIGKVENI